MDRAIGVVWQAAPKWTILSTFLIVIQAVVPLAILFIIKLVVDQLTSGGGEFGARGDFQDVVLLIFAALLATVIGNLSSAALSHSNLNQSHEVADHMQRVVQTKSIDMDLAYYENPQYYDKLHRAQREAPSRPVQIVQGLTQLARNSLTLIGALGLLFLFHWGIVAAVFFASVPILFYRLRQAEAVYALHRDMTANQRLSAYINKVITTADDAKEVRVFGFGPLMVQRFRDLRNRMRASLRRISAQGARRQFVTESAAALAGYGSLAVIAHAALGDAITLGELVMYFGAFQVALGSLRPTLGGLAAVYESNLFLSALYEFLEVPRSVAEPEQPRRMPHPWRRGLEVERLSFRYPGTDRLVLDGIDLSIRPGEIVALVGKNGSGKTTLTKLLCRLYDPGEGRITVDGIDFRDFETDDLRREIGVIYQDFGRYKLSARENILLGRPELSPDDPSIVNAAQLAGIHDDLVRLPKDYDTVLSRSFVEGEELSIGQWQKLAIARALLRDSQLILLDEPTSSLDPAAEFEFFEKFRSLVCDRSALVISHRFSTIRLADRIYVLEAGCLVEQGDHEGLMHLDGLYAGLFRKQASYYQPAIRSRNR